MAQLFAVMQSLQGLLQTLWIKPWWLRLGTLHP